MFTRPFASLYYLGYNEALNGKAWMSGKRNIGIIIREQRKSIPLTISQLSKMSSVSIAHLSRIEKGERTPSPHTLQLVAKPLGFDLNELLIVAGYLAPEPSSFSEQERKKLRTELDTLLKRLVSDSDRIKVIVNRLLLSS